MGLSSSMTYAAALVPQLSLAVHQWHNQRRGLRPTLTSRFSSKGSGGTSEGSDVSCSATSLKQSLVWRKGRPELWDILGRALVPPQPQQ